ncbi:molecular chaperone HtpG [Marinoscillum furvescens]|uniref:Chaperone protein HtpG n=1 Tax=Marinoscillum furvescens DSM 4134 TaxID=1122208 RepID=A0A3D9L4M0_MARFU|nr:molecular chaperone HtpG [Marinoscillum furvescens]REE00575.1 molecular chaperone HtpG [Marinoscillum furvescens DSM 4134]
MQEKGTISIHTENIFPIIKKFLYSDHEIFLRELVSNAVDASQKIKRLASLGEYKGELGELIVDVKVDKKKKTITISDRGIGMTADEIKKYINQIAFSGATEFVEKYKDKGEDQQIIGHFGLGFYSAFMVAKHVEIHTLSYQEGAEPAIWSCDGNTEFEIKPGKKKERGTDIILKIADDSEEFLEDHRIQGILDKYSKFLPIPIRFGEKEKQEEDGEDKDGKKKWKTVKVDNIINNPTPLWTRSPSDLTDQDYLDFYKELYPFSEEPLFWIHLNVDYPFNLTGILYFPKLKKDFEFQKNKIQLYSRQVFITDEVKDIVPDFLQLLHGVIDSPDIPLNVSRSYLQSDSNVKKINGYITKKVADKLGELFKKDRKAYEEKWSDIGVFVKYGIISEDKFEEKAKDYALLKSTEGKFYNIDEYKAAVEANQTNKDKSVVFLYTTDEEQQHGYIETAKKRSYNVLVLDGPVDSHFINHVEQKYEGVTLKRVDSDVIDKLIDKDEKKESVLSEDEQNKVTEAFKKAVNDEKNTITVEPMATDDLPVTITLPEFIRRMRDMQATGGGGPMMFGEMPLNLSVAVNANHAFTKKIVAAESEDEQVALAKQAYDWALLSQGMLSGKKLTDFINRSVELASK